MHLKKLLNKEAKRNSAADAQKFQASLLEHQRQVDASLEQKEKDLLRSHQMTLTVLGQFRDYMMSAEAKLLAQELQMQHVNEMMEYLQARNKQTEDLAKAVVLFVRNEGLPEQQPMLSTVIKQAREATPLPPKPSGMTELASTESRKAEVEKKAAAMREDDLFRTTPKLVTLCDRVREFERFLALKKEQQMKKEILKGTEKIQDDDGAALQSTASSKIIEMTGDSGISSTRRFDHGLKGFSLSLSLFSDCCFPRFCSSW